VPRERIYLHGDREINTDAMMKAIIGNLRLFRLDPDEILSNIFKRMKRNSSFLHPGKRMPSESSLQISRKANIEILG